MNKHLYKPLIWALLFCIIFSVPTLATPTVTLDGKQMSFDVPAIIENNTTLVPLRAIFESLGATVEWNDQTQTVTAIKTGTQIKLTLGQATAYKNGSPVSLAVPAKSINNRTMVPLRFVSEALGAQVNWDGYTQTITILSVPTPGSTMPPSGITTVHFIDVGQADAIYIDLPGNDDILIDGGNVADSTTVVNYLKAHGVDTLELLIATHPHEDHIGGLPSVLETFKVNEIVDSGMTATTNIYSRYTADAKAEGCTWVADNRQTFTWGNVALQILTGPETWQDVNDYSVVTRLDCGNIEFLFDGDAEAPAEAALQGDISAEILKVGHHGSTSSSSYSFLSRVMPQVAIVSVGTGNTYGHPAAGTLTKLQATGSKIYRTDLNGNIVVTTDGNTYTVVTDKTLPVPAVPVITPAPTTPAQSTGVYVGSIKSDKYHYPSCRYAQAILSGNQIWFASEAEALAAGYGPCGVCKP